MQSKQGMTMVNAVVANDGRLVVVVEWPDGTSRLLDRDEAVLLSLTMLKAASHLFPSATEFGQSIDAARGKVEPLHPARMQ